MQLDCKSMTGIIYNCPNLDECLENSPLNRMEAIRLYYLNQGVKPEELQIKDRPYRRSQRNHQPGHRGDFIYNKDSETRDRIVFGAPVQWGETYGGLKNFSSLTVEKLQQLIAQRFADPLSGHNNSPTIREFREFAQQQARKGFIFYFEGYAISPAREEDYRVAIDAILFNGSCPHQLIVEFQEFVGDPDELDLDPYYLRAWWN